MLGQDLSMPEERDSNKIIKDILSAAVKEVGRLELMHAVNLSYARTAEYIQSLVLDGLLECRRGGAIYKTTTKGLLWLDSVA